MNETFNRLRSNILIILAESNDHARCEQVLKDLAEIREWMLQHEQPLDLLLD